MRGCFFIVRFPSALSAYLKLRISGFKPPDLLQIHCVILGQVAYLGALPAHLENGDKGIVRKRALMY